MVDWKELTAKEQFTVEAVMESIRNDEIGEDWMKHEYEDIASCARHWANEYGDWNEGNIERICEMVNEFKSMQGI